MFLTTFIWKLKKLKCAFKNVEFEISGNWGVFSKILNLKVVEIEVFLQWIFVISIYSSLSFFLLYSWSILSPSSSACPLLIIFTNSFISISLSSPPSAVLVASTSSLKKSQDLCCDVELLSSAFWISSVVVSYHKYVDIASTNFQKSRETSYQGQNFFVNQLFVAQVTCYINSFGGMGLNIDPLFLLLFAVKSYSINSRGICLLSSHNESEEQDLQSMIFRLYIRYILHVLWYSESVEFFMSSASTFFIWYLV